MSRLFKKLLLPILLKAGLLILICTLLIPAHAAVSFVRDSSQLQQRQFSKPAMDKYKGDKTFHYSDDAPQQSGIMGIISYYFNRLLARIFSVHIGRINIFTMLFAVLLVFGVVMLIFHFLKIKPQSLFSRSAALITVDGGDGADIHTVDFDRLIGQAAAQQNYRLAVRFWYLKMLKIMSDAQLINWQISKTNYDYYYELKQQTLRNEFLVLTHTFETAWYGNNALSDERYSEAVASFRTFFTILTGRK